MKTSDYININKSTWNDKVDVHIESDFYDMEGFLNGKLTLNAIEAFRTFEGSREKRIAEQKKMAEEALEKLAAGFQKTESGLRYQIIQKGNGTKAEKGKKVSVHYQGALENGQVFDSSYKRKQPIDFQLGVGQVIEGWDEGIVLLKVGDKARFVIPSYLGYGSRGAGGVIPPDATLVFDVELMDVK